MQKRGQLFLMSAPSGAGKTSLMHALLQQHPNLRFSVSFTTRPRRPNETDARDYHFVSVTEFKRMVAAGEFLEHACVFDNYYGTARESVEQELLAGHDVLLEIDWQGARQVRQLMPEAVSVFILPPSLAELRQRLLKRAEQERRRLMGPEHAATEAERRFRDAVADISHWAEFDYVVVNDDFSHALAALGDILAGRGDASRAARADLRAVVSALLA